MLTKRQKETLDFIKKYRGKMGYSPSLEEIKNHLRLSSVSTAHHHVKALERLGFLSKERDQPRGINIYQSEQMVQVSILGTIAAGNPIEAMEDKEIIAIPRSKLPSSLENIYALKVCGNSMIDENIHDGDIVLVRHQSTANNGEKVVALINNHEVTLKTLFKEKGVIRLQPANKKMEPIIIKSGNAGFAIQGVVLGVIKAITSSK